MLTDAGAPLQTRARICCLNTPSRVLFKKDCYTTNGKEIASARGVPCDLGQVDFNRFHLGPELEGVLAELTALAGLLVPAEGGGVGDDLRENR